MGGYHGLAEYSLGERNLLIGPSFLAGAVLEITLRFQPTARLREQSQTWLPSPLPGGR